MSRMNPIAMGWFVCINVILEIIIKIFRMNCVISKRSRGSLWKILILGINEKDFLFSWSFKNKNFFLVYKTNVLYKLLKLMLDIYFLIYIFMFLVGVLVFVLNRKHLLSILLRLEFIVLALFILLFFYLLSFGFQEFFSIIFLTFTVCEGALGLSILVSLIRTHGNDYFQTFRILQC